MFGVITDRLDVVRTVEDGDEQAGVACRGAVEHRLARGKVAVAARTDDRVVHKQSTFEDDDRMRGRVPMDPRAEADRIPDQVVLRAREWIAEEEADAELGVMDD